MRPTTELAEWVKAIVRANFEFAETVSFPIPPVPASRPRVTRWGTYYAKGYAAWIKAATPTHPATNDPDATSRFHVVIDIIGEKPRTSKLPSPRGDVDNYAKGPLDIVTKNHGVWKDDSQIDCLFVSKRWAEPNETPRTDVHIWKEL